MFTIKASIRTLLSTILVLALVFVGTAPATADELPATEGGSVDTCEDVAVEATAAIDELDAMLPVDLVDEPEVVGRIQTVLRQMDHDLRSLGC